MSDNQGGQRYGYNPYGSEDERPAGYQPAQGQPTQQQPTRQQPTQQYAQPQYAQDPRYASPYQQSYQPAPQPPAPGKDGKKGAPRAFVFVLGLFGGLAGAVALVAALYFGGVFGGGSSTSSGTSGSTSSTSGTTQNITINPDSEDSSVAEAVAQKCLPSVVTITVETDSGEALGSGVILDTDGNIITNYHLFEYGNNSISVDIEGKTYSAELVGSDESSDIAVIKADLQGASVTPIERGDSDDLVVGSWVMTIGSPFGLEQSVSTGIVSALYRSTTMTLQTGTAIYANLIQVDAAINTGNSGGALVNDQGQLVGISTLLTSSSGDFSGIAFAIPGNYALNIADKIIAGEQVTHAYIGLSLSTVNAQNAEYNKLSVDQGAYVAEVADDGPADQAGIKQGDIITAIDGEEITSADGLIIAIRTHEEGDVVKVTYNRDGKEETVEVTLGNDEELQKQQAAEAEQQQQSQSDQSYNPFDPFGQMGNGQ
ncbi:MAG: trypsin-like peptidase domain-containing protein [Olegusella sp.]|nr:trypsin-like peptidase domain-containing protein [Olegusella sp.]